MKKLSLLFIILPSLLMSQKIIEEEISLKNDAISLPGTLSYLSLKEKQALAIFVHGSGNVDRNGNQNPFIKANYIAQLADSLTKRGIAFYRYDKRTSKPANLKLLEDISIYDFADDVQLAIKHFSTDKRFKSIHLIGHSQGSLVAMLATNASTKSYTSIAGPSESIDKTLISQITKQSADLGKVAEEHIKELKETDTIVEVNPFLVQLFAPQNQKFIKTWMQLNPKEELKKVKKPILIIQGGKDLQVTKVDATNLINACATTNAGFGAPAQLVFIENMNHVLKTIENPKENQESYGSPDFPLSKKLVHSISTFILKNE